MVHFATVATAAAAAAAAAAPTITAATISATGTAALDNANHQESASVDPISERAASLATSIARGCN